MKDYTTTFTFDDANQLVSSTTDGVTTRYAYDAAGRMVREGNKTYAYGYLDKVMSVTEGDKTYTYTYHADGQLASANYGGKTEGFTWDGLALVQRGDEHFLNEPHVGGGNPVASSKGTTYFNDMLGTTVGAKKDGKYSAAALTAFGETIENGGVRSTPTPSTYTSFFTGKPEVAGLGHAFLFRNYRAGLAKWQTADPLGYPDGWNQLAYCGNGVTGAVDLLGCVSQSHIVTDNSWIGWGPYVSEDGIKASFCIYAYGTCNHDYDNLDITACDVALSVGCTDLLYNYKSKDGKIGSINFDYTIVGISKPPVTIGFAGMKTAYADITVDLSLDFTYYVKVVTNGKEEYKPFHVIIASTQYVFHLKDSVSKPFRPVKE